MKKIFLLATVVLLTACSNPTQKALIEYSNNQLGGIADLETKALAAYSSVQGANYTTDSVMYFTVKDKVLPDYEKFCDGLNKIQTEIKDEKVKELNQIYIDASHAQKKAFNVLLDALYKSDANLVTEANKDLAEAREDLNKWTEKYNSLCKEYNVVHKK